jgi:hypothetical protein
MMMRDMRSFGVRCGIVAAMAIATGCGGESTDVGEADVDTALQQDVAQSGARPFSKKRSGFIGAPTLQPQTSGPEANALPQNKLLPNDGGGYDSFGASVGISGTTAVVGAVFDDDMGPDSGSAYVFVDDAGVWTQQAKLVAKDGKPGDYFGISVAVAGDRLIVGAAEAAANGVKTGAAYIYERANKVWTLKAKLAPSTGAAGDQFGYAVALEGNVAIVGAPQSDAIGSDGGAAYVFKYNGTTWQETAKLLPSAGGPFGYFGGAVALYGTTALVGAWDDGSGLDAGAIFAYGENNGVWVQQAHLTASDGQTGDTFGFAVAIYGNKAFIGAPYHDSECVDSGAVYVFGRYSGQWCEEAIILPTDKNAAQAFGSSVAVFGDMAALGSFWDDDNGDYSGSAYAYQLVDDVWTEKFKYLPNDGLPGQLFGVATSMDGDRVVVGAYGDDDNGIDSGSAYTFSVLEDPNNPPPQPIKADELDEAAAVPQCSMRSGAPSNQSSWFIGIGLAALGFRRLSRKTNARS